MFKRYSLQIGMAAILVVFIAALGVAVYALNSANNSLREFAHQDLEIYATASEIQAYDLILVDSVKGLIINPGDPYYTEVYDEYAELIDGAIERMIELDPASAATFEEIDQLNSRLLELEGQMMQLAAAGEQDQAAALLAGEYGDVGAQFDAIMADFLASQQQGVFERALSAEEANQTLRNVSLIVGGVAIVIFIIISITLFKGIIGPVRKLADVSARIAAGDLTVNEVSVDSKGEVGQLANSFNVMLQNLREIIQQINEKSQSVASSATELSASADNVSAGASETSATISQVASTAEQVTKGTQHIADTSTETANFAREGSRELSNVVNQMGAIQEVSSSTGNVIRELNNAAGRITQIVELITQIADQTNLLALNAAIEAARAGEHGRGFAVVAEEVRKLAEQSADAAKEIQTLIGDIQTESQKAVSTAEQNVTQVEEGVDKVKKVNSVFDKIISAVEGLAGEIQQVASSTGEMSSAVQNVAATSEEQTASMEEVASTTQDLSRMAEELEAIAKRFKTDGNTEKAAVDTQENKPEFKEDSAEDHF